VTLHLEILCGSTAYALDSVDDTTDPSNPKITITSTAGCPAGQLNAIWQWIEDSKWAVFVILVVLGLFIGFFGRKMFKPVLFIAGVVVAVALVLLIFYSTFLKSNTKAWVGWVVLACAVLLGLGVGALFVKVSKLGAFVLAGWGGFSVALLIYNAFLYKMNSEAGMWAFCIGVALLFGVLALYFFEHILIHATALIGAYLAIAGLGLVAGRYQNPFTIAEQRSTGVIVNIDPAFYGYLAATLVLYALGAFVQYRQRRQDKEHGHDPYHGAGEKV